MIFYYFVLVFVWKSLFSRENNSRGPCIKSYVENNSTPPEITHCFDNEMYINWLVPVARVKSLRVLAQLKATSNVTIAVNWLGSSSKDGLDGFPRNSGASSDRLQPSLPSSSEIRLRAADHLDIRLLSGEYNEANPQNSRSSARSRHGLASSSLDCEVVKETGRLSTQRVTSSDFWWRGCALEWHSFSFLKRLLPIET